jgi:hypothetical protein
MEVLHEFAGVPGVSGGRLQGPITRSAGGFMAGLRRHRTVSAAGDYGSTMVWRDDDGMFRCAFMVYGRFVDMQVFKLKREVRCWLLAWLPKMHEQPTDGSRG